MEATEEITCAPHIVKGRRTKRQRLLHPSAALATSSSSSEVSARTAMEEEEEDMANCLILLAQGHVSSHLPICPSPDSDNKETATAPTEKISGRGVAANGKGAAGSFYAYECKTCNKCFPSFQALGGHRTSHKKSNKSPVTPAWPVVETKTAEISADAILLSMNTFSGVSANGKIVRAHECSICGSVFASGQALGGHMRRHRPASLPEPVQAKKVRSNIMLTFDLNLPAPSEDYGTSPSSASATAAAAAGPDFSFTSKPPLLLPRSALIDCHY